MPKKLTAFIVEDEQDAVRILQKTLDNYLQDRIEYIGHSSSLEEITRQVEQLQPDILFLDVELDGFTGFDVLDKLQEFKGHVIFTTGHDGYAIKAIRYAALDYILKPVDPDDLIAAVDRIPKVQPTKTSTEIRKMASDQIRTKSFKRIALPSSEGMQIVELGQIAAIIADGAYSKILMIDNQEFIVSRIIKEFEELLPEPGFLRIHRSVIVNLEEVSSYIRGRGGEVILNNGFRHGVAAGKKDTLLSYFNQL